MGNCQQTGGAAGAAQSIPGIYEPPSKEVMDELYSSGRCHIFRGVSTSTSASSKVTTTDKITAVNPVCRILGNRLVIKRSQKNKELWGVGFEYEATAPCKVVVYFGAQEAQGLNKNSAPMIKGQAAPLIAKCEDGNFMEFNQETYSEDHFFSPSMFTLQAQAGYYPIVVEMTADSPSGKQKHLYYGSLPDFKPKHAGNEQKVQIVKQGIEIGGTFHILQEIYGLAQASDGDGAGGKQLEAENECIVCLTDQKDTSLMPCRHMCVCQSCGQDLVDRTMKCPICRQPVTALLTLARQAGVSQIKQNALLVEPEEVLDDDAL
jgi:hypothetical protein